ncbi:hypothetical protein FB451DRAFT_1257664 [Mycena latifolia]|nr:hypothetical protein FB451DRAFT_1257664 [Mycena latifolia]
MGKDSLTQVFGTVKVTPNMRDLLPNYRMVLEWARMSLASTVFEQFMTSEMFCHWSFSSSLRLSGHFKLGLLEVWLPIHRTLV